MSEEKKLFTEGVEVDKNMIIETKIEKDDIRFYDVRKPPFDVYGLYEYRTEPIFHRLPTEVGEATSAGVAKLERECAGGRVRFCTDSPYVAISVESVKLGRTSHTPLEASGGFDLYEDYPNGLSKSRFAKAFQPPYSTELTYEQCVDVGAPKLRYFTLNFPLHSVVKNVYIGLSDQATLGGGLHYRNRRPVVVYGSSIVHGTGPSRPGLAYTNMLTRRMNLDVRNIGFSGRAKAEEAIVNYLSEMEMSIFVCDYDHNAPNVDHLRATHLPMYKRFRESQPDTPYVMISRPDVLINPAGAARLRDVIVDTFRYAREQGDKNVYYIDGESFFLGKVEEDCTIDRIHPNDMGNSLMADGVEHTLRLILAKGNYLD